MDGRFAGTFRCGLQPRQRQKTLQKQRSGSSMPNLALQWVNTISIGTIWEIMIVPRMGDQLFLALLANLRTVEGMKWNEME